MNKIDTGKTIPSPKTANEISNVLGVCIFKCLIQMIQVCIGVQVVIVMVTSKGAYTQTNGGGVVSNYKNPQRYKNGDYLVVLKLI